MDLPTYTNIWRIEKRLYKLYDFNLPTPLPMVQIGVFIGVFASWVVFLQLVGLPFQPPWHVVYLVPPGVVTYLATRPVLEGKRLTELVVSQLRYVTEPRLWCRLVPAYEPGRVSLLGAVWRLTPRAARVAGAGTRQRGAPDPVTPRRHPPSPVGTPGGTAPPVAAPPLPAAPAPPSSAAPAPPPTAASPLPAALTPSPATPPPATVAPAPPPTTSPAQAPTAPAPRSSTVPAPPAPASPRGRRRGIRRAVRNEWAARRRPSKQAVGEMAVQAGMAFPGTRRIVVLGCVGGAGQTTTALMLGHSLARHRRDRCIAVDVNPGRGSLAHLSRMESPETLASLLAGIDNVTGYLGLRRYTSQSGSGLEVLASDDDTAVLDSIGERDLAATAGVLDRFYKISLFDPAAAVAPRVLPLADQLVLVAPAAGGAASGVEAALEWLDRRGYRPLAAGAVLLVNGVTKGTDAGEVAAVGAGCRAAVPIPRDDHLNPRRRAPAGLEIPGALPPAVRGGYLRLASTVVAGFSAPPDRYRQMSEHGEFERKEIAR